MIATWNGERFLNEQLSSLELQSENNIDIWVSDDGSTDATLDILQNFGAGWSKGKFSLLHHKRHTQDGIDTPAFGSNENFRSLILNPEIYGDYFAFGDQDDIWDDDKLERAGSWLSSQPAEIPCLYCSRTRIVDENGNVTGIAPLFSKPPSLENAVVQNIAAGNTIVMNKRAMELVRMAARETDFVSHDWWCYIVVAAFKGHIFYDSEPGLSYRQHGNNLIGENSSWKARMTRTKQVIQGRFKRWNNRNRNALGAIQEHLPEDTKKFLQEYDNARSKKWLGAVIALKRLGVHRQTSLGHLSLYFAALIGKI